MNHTTFGADTQATVRGGHYDVWCHSASLRSACCDTLQGFVRERSGRAPGDAARIIMMKRTPV